METLRSAARQGSISLTNRAVQEHPGVLSECISPNTADNPLHIAAKHGHAPFLRYLFDRFDIGDRRAAAYLKDECGYTCIHWAATIGHIKVVQFLMEIDPQLCSKTDDSGWTPLHHATSASKIPIIKLILSKHQASLEDFTAKKETCLHIAVKNKHCEAFEFLVNRMSHANIIRVINKSDDEGNTILHIAVENRLIQVVEKLLNSRHLLRHLDINGVNGLGLTPLNLCDRGVRDILLIKMLEHAGAHKNHSFDTFLDYISHLTDERRSNIVTLLITLAFVTLQVFGGPTNVNLLGSKQSKFDIIHLLLKPGQFFWMFYGSLSLTIVLTMCMIGIVFFFRSSPARILVGAMLFIFLVYYSILMASKMGNFTVLVYRSWEISIIYILWVGVMVFYVVVVPILISLWRFIRRLRRLMCRFNKNSLPT